MGILDRIRTVGSEPPAVESSETSPSSTLVVVEPAVLRRFKGLIKILEGRASKDPKLRRISFILDAFVEELCAELEDRKPAELEGYLMMVGLIVEWVGHGNTEVLPKELQAFADMIEPRVTVVATVDDVIADPKEILA